MVYDPTGDWPTLAQVNKELDGAGKLTSKTIELLNQNNEIYQDMPFVEANEGTTYLHFMDADVPSGTWRRVNEGITAVSSSTIQVRDTAGMIENRAECDVIAARASGDVAKFRARQDRRIISGLNIDIAQTLFYGDVRTNPERFFGFSPRYDNLGNPSDKPTANTFGMSHVLSAGGTTASSQSSIWLIGWAPEDGAFGFYPKTAPSAGVESEDLGMVDLRDANGKVFRGYATHHRIQQGLAIGDWRNIVRIANIESAATLDDAAIKTLCNLMIDATMAIPDLKMVRPIFYMNRTILSRLQKAAMNINNLTLGYDDLYGVQHQLNISKCPIKLCDALLNTEAVIAA